MNRIESIEDLAQALGDGGPFRPDVCFERVEEVVDALVELGRTDKVLVRYDDHLGLKNDLSEEFLTSPLSNSANPEFEEEIAAVLEQANRIIPLSERELSDDDIEDIREDKISRGERDDD